MSASKLDHKELQRRLKEDEVAHFFEIIRDDIVKIYEQYGRQVLTVVGLVAVILVAVYFWNMKSSNDFQASQQLYANAIAYVQKDQYPEALNELNSLVNSYSGSQVAVSALILRGDCFVKTGSFENALTDYRQAVGKLPLEDAVIVRFAIVQTLRSLERPDEAIQELDTIDTQTKSPSVKEQVVYLRGCCMEDKNDTAKALELFKSLTAKSKWYPFATEKIAWLEAQAASAINAK